MTGGVDSTPRSPTDSKQALAALAVVGLVVASLAPAVGVALADGTSAVGVPTTDVSVSNPLNQTDEQTTTSEGRTTTSDERTTVPEVTMPVLTPTETPAERTSTTESTSERDTTVRTTTVPASTTATTSTETDDPERDRTTTSGDGLPDPGSNETVWSPGPPGGNGPPEDGGPPDEPGPPGDAGPPEGVRPPGLGGPPDVTDPGETDLPGRVGDGTTPPGLSENRSGPPADRPGRSPNRPGRPGNGSGFPGNGAFPGNGPFPGNATDVPGNGTFPGNRTLPENATRRGRPVRSGDAPTVNVTVENASANESVAVNVSTPADRSRNVSFSTVEVTPTRNASFTLNVTASDRPIAEKTPTEELSNGTEPLAFLSVDHSIPDRNISSVNFTFRLRRDRVNDSERDEIALYRYHDGSWNELPTTLVETTASHYVYRVRSPGLSEFAAGKQRPQFEITNATVDISTLSVGDALKVRVRITNAGEADGTFTAELVLGDRSVADRQLTIAAGGMRQTTFERTVAEPGVYEVYVNEFRAGEVAVNATAVSSATDDANGSGQADAATDRGESETDGQSGTGTTAGVPGFGVALGVVALLGSLAVARWRD